MKTFILLLIFSLGYSQKVIVLNDYYHDEGVIFNDNVKYPFIEDDYASHYCPSIDEIKNSENILFENYYDHKTEVLNYFNLEKEKINSKYKKPHYVKKMFFKYNRQYISYINIKNEIIIYIGLLNFCNKKKSRKYFENWKEDIIAGAGGFYMNNQEYYIINVTKKLIIKKVTQL